MKIQTIEELVARKQYITDLLKESVCVIIYVDKDGVIKNCVGTLAVLDLPKVPPKIKKRISRDMICLYDVLSLHYKVISVVSIISINKVGENSNV
jgi:hypothetical protein